VIKDGAELLLSKPGGLLFVYPLRQGIRGNKKKTSTRAKTKKTFENLKKTKSHITI